MVKGFLTSLIDEFPPMGVIEPSRALKCLGSASYIFPELELELDKNRNVKLELFLSSSSFRARKSSFWAWARVKLVLSLNLEKVRFELDS